MPELYQKEKKSQLSLRKLDFVVVARGGKRLYFIRTLYYYYDNNIRVVGRWSHIKKKRPSE